MKNKKIIIISSIILLLMTVTVLVVIFFISTYKKEIEKKERMRLAKEYYDNKIALYEEEANQHDSVDVLFLGDSLTDGYDLSKYYPEYVTLNRGIAGETTHGLLNRIEVSTNVKAKVIVMLIGANNFDTMMDDYEDIVLYLTGIKDTKVVLLSLTAMSKEWGKNNDKAILNNQKIKLIAKKYDLIFVDLFTPLCNVETNMIFDEYTVDGGHLTDAGYKVITKEIKNVLKELIP